MLKSGGQLKAFNPDLLHVTCLAHAFHRVSECVPKLFPEVNELISVTKKEFLKAPSRVLAWKNAHPNLPLPPQPVVTRWGTWVNAENIEAVRTVVESFDPPDSEAIRKCQLIVCDDEMKSGLSYIAANLHFLPHVIQALERQGMSLTESFASVSKAETAIHSLPGIKGETIKHKYESIYARNPDIAVLRTVESVISEGKGVLPDNMSPQRAAAFKFVPVTSVDVERSFSMYKTILSDNRRRLKSVNLTKILVSHCFYR